jgi:hypothetical protein
VLDPYTALFCGGNHDVLVEHRRSGRIKPNKLLVSCLFDRTALLQGRRQL